MGVDAVHTPPDLHKMHNMQEAGVERRGSYSAREAADLLGVSVWTLYRRIDEGKLTDYRAGGGRRRRVTATALEAFMRRHGIPLPWEDDAARVYRVLIVDDEADVRRMISDVLRRDSRFVIETAASGFQAGLALASRPPNLVLLDIQLGDMDGRELLEHIATQPGLAATRVIAVSGYIREVGAAALLEQGFDGYAPKPLRVDRLRAVIDDVLNRPAAATRRASGSGPGARA